MNNVIPVTNAHRIRDMEQVLKLCDAVELVVAHEPDPAVRMEKAERLERTRQRTMQKLSELRGEA